MEYNGDGVMAIFGAPVALEDHAFRACLAGLAIQAEVSRLAAEVQCSDGVDLRLRVGLNSGRVIAGEIGSGSLGYAAIGQQVGMAQRMESVAPAGAVMLSESTARLVEHIVLLAVPTIKAVKSVGADSFTAGGTVETFEPGTARRRPSRRGLCRGSTQSCEWRHAETPRARPRMPRHHRCALR